MGRPLTFSRRELQDRAPEMSREIARRIAVAADDVRDLLYPEIVRRCGRG